MASTNTLKVAAKSKAEQNKPITDSLNSVAAANVYKAEVAKITATDIRGRAKALLKAVNKALAAAGIPPISTVKVLNLSSDVKGSYQSKNSTMTINDTVLRGKNLSSEAITTVFHEAVHHQQTYNVARYLAITNTAKDIKAYTQIDSSLVDKAAKAVKDSVNKKQSPLTPSQFQTAQNIYKYLYDKTNTVPYERVNEQGVKETKNYQYSTAYYLYEADARATIDLIKKNPGKYPQEDINRAYQVYRDAYEKYQALPQEQEAFAAEQLLQSTKQVALKTSSQNTNLLVDNINQYSDNQLTSVSNISSQSTDSIEVSRVESVASNTSNNNYFAENDSSQNNSASRTNDAMNLPKVVRLFKDNAAEVKQQYGFDVNTEDGLGKAVMSYWKKNKLDLEILKEQLPNLKESEFNIALAKTEATETKNTKQLALS